MIILPVPFYSVDPVWDRVARVLQPAVDRYDGYTMNEVKAMIKSRRWQLWLAVDENNKIHAAGVTTINVYPQKKTCLILYVAGEEMKNWLHLMRDIESWAGQNGCKDLELRGRRGWSRVFADFDETGVICHKQIGD